MMLVVGVDRCGSGWLSIARRVGRPELVAEVRDVNGVIDLALLADVVAVDVPIGLPDFDDRACDKAARQVLGAPRASSVFPVPVRAVIDAVDYEDAKRRSLEASGKSIAQQTFAIVPGIKEFDDALRRNPPAQSRTHEVHAEVSFWAWNGRRAMRDHKATPSGYAERLVLISAYFGGVFDAIHARTRGRSVDRDDILDALAALWTAERIAAGTAETLPTPIERDRFGLPMAITF